KHGEDDHIATRWRGKKAREQSNDERDPADDIDDQARPDPGERRIEYNLDEAADIGRRPARDLAPAVHQEIPAYRDAHDRPGEGNDEGVERLQAGKDQLGLLLGLGLNARHELSSLG